MNGLLCLTWNNHYSTFLKLLTNLHLKDLYCDATIACHGKYYPVHRLVLSTCSEYFEDIFGQTKCKHPFIILKDIKPSELEALLNYMYKGEVNVSQEALPELIKAAEGLRIRGLAVSDEIPEKQSNVNEGKRNIPYGDQAMKRKRRASNSNSEKDSFYKSDGIEKSKNIDGNLQSGHSVFLETLSNKEVVQSVEKGSAFKSEGRVEQEHNDGVVNENTNHLGVENIKTEVLDVPIYSEDSGAHQDLGLPQELPCGSSFGPNELISSEEVQHNTFRSLLISTENDECTEKEELQSEIPETEYSLNPSTMESPLPSIIKNPVGTFGSNSTDNLLGKSFHSGRCYSCSLCSHESHTSSNLRLHYLFKHSNIEKPYACTFCSYRCFYKNDLVKHKRKHTGEKPFKCSVCSYRATQKHHIDNHMRTHTGEKPYKCRFCPYKSTTKSTLTYHQMVKHGAKSSISDGCQPRI